MAITMEILLSSVLVITSIAGSAYALGFKIGTLSTKRK